MTKRKKRSHKKSSSAKKSKDYLFYLLIFVLGLAIMGVAMGLSVYFYRLGYAQGVEDTKASLHKIPTDKQYYEQKKRSIPQLSEIEDYRQNINSSQSSSHSSGYFSSSSKVSSKNQKTKKPRLAIIIDDVAYSSQVRAIKALGMPINVSFFPPTSTHPNTPKYAKGLSHYMIHLPMEAKHYSREEHYTLRPTATTGEMDRYIAKLRKEFPRARCINNHTGSRFTADYKAMKRLIKVLDRYHFCFLDSRTTPKTQVPRVMRHLHRPYLARDIFLDNDIDVAKIKAQLKKAVRLAKRKGLAIAIGHPHAKTLEAIRRSKGILKEVRLIYVDELLH